MADISGTSPQSSQSAFGRAASNIAGKAGGWLKGSLYVGGVSALGVGAYSLYQNDRFRHEFGRAAGAAGNKLTELWNFGGRLWNEGLYPGIQTQGGNELTQILAGTLGLALAFGANKFFLSDKPWLVKAGLGTALVVGLPLLAATGVGMLRDDPQFNNSQQNQVQQQINASDAGLRRYNPIDAHLPPGL